MAKSIINKRTRWPKNPKPISSTVSSSTQKSFEDIRQSLDEFFTPKFLAEIMYRLAVKYGFAGGKVLEPSFGGGVFFKVLSENGIQADNLYGFEIYKPNFDDVTQQFPEAHLFPYNFEFQFAKDRKALLRDGYAVDVAFDDVVFDLVIGNPPYGSHKSPYAYLFDQDIQIRAEGFFIYLALQRLIPGGLLVFVINSLWLLNGEKYNAQKEKIAAMADLIDAYRLPNNIFKGENRDTSIATDIVIFKKR